MKLQSEAALSASEMQKWTLKLWENRHKSYWCKGWSWYNKVNLLSFRQPAEIVPWPNSSNFAHIFGTVVRNSFALQLTFKIYSSEEGCFGIAGQPLLYLGPTYCQCFDVLVIVCLHCGSTVQPKVRSVQGVYWVPASTKRVLKKSDAPLAQAICEWLPEWNVSICIRENLQNWSRWRDYTRCQRW